MPEEMDGQMDADRRMERRMAELGPLLERRQRAEAEGVDPTFARELRNRLVSESPAGEQTGRTGNPHARRRPPVLLTGVFAAALASAIVLLIVLRRPQSSPTPTLATVPRPTQADLMSGYPPEAGTAGGGGPGIPSPIVSPVQGYSARPYAGRLALSTGHVSSGPSTRAAYRLDGPPLTRVGFQRQVDRLGIRDHAHIVDGTWLVAADGGKTRVNRKTAEVYATPLHSLAMSLNTGELIYQDTRPEHLAHQAPPMAHGRALQLARNWLAQAGLHLRGMVVRSVSAVAPASSELAVSYDWHGVSNPVEPSATIYVTSRGRITALDVWPPVDQTLRVRSVPVSTAWHQVEVGNAPITVPGYNHILVVPGGGEVTALRVVQVLVAGKHGRQYLVPVYRFSGTVRLHGVSYRWYAQTPAASSAALHHE
jgi:hypothetical protein